MRPRSTIAVAADGVEAGHAGRERADAGHDETVGLDGAASASAVTVTAAPTRSSARWAERRLPEP